MNLQYIHINTYFTFLLYYTEINTNMKISTSLSIAMITALLAFSLISIKAVNATPSTPFKQCPPVGQNTGCAILIWIDSNGSVTILSDNSQGPYDGIEDTLVGVQDDCTKCGVITSIVISATSGTFPPIFYLDGDGACSGIYSPNPPQASCPGGAFTTADPQDYESNNVTFSGISSDQNTGTLNFNPGLTGGTHAWFSLENSLSSTQLNIQTISTTATTQTTGVPEFPASTLLMIGPLALVLAVLIRMRKERAATKLEA